MLGAQSWSVSRGGALERVVNFNLMHTRIFWARPTPSLRGPVITPKTPDTPKRGLDAS